MDEILKKYNDARVAYEVQERKVHDLREQLSREEAVLNETQRGLSAAKGLVDLHLNQPANTGAAAAEPYAGVHPHVPVTPPRTAEEQAHEEQAIRRGTELGEGNTIVGVGQKGPEATLDDRIVGSVQPKADVEKAKAQGDKGKSK